LSTTEEYDVDEVKVVISGRFWTEQLGSDPHVVGRVLNLDGTGQTVIGVMPPVLVLFPETDIWAKIEPDFRWMRIRGNKFLDVVGRLKPGVTSEQAEQELTAILQRGPGESQELSVHLIPLKDELTANVRSQLQLVMATVSLVMLFAFFITAFTGLLLALASSTASSNLDVIARLKTERKGSASIAGQRSSLLLVSEVCLAVVLSIAAGLLLRSFEQAEHLDPGFLP